MKIRILIWMGLVFAAAFVLFGAESYLMQQGIAKNTLRLHVVANSNCEEDQAHKLVVRDAVLTTVGALTADCTDAKQAQSIISQNLSEIEAAAEAVSEHEISVSLREENFDTRYYDTFTLPAGNYTALRVNIGAAEGKNWWCVVFPSLCTAASADSLEKCAQTAGFDEGQTDLVVGGEERYVLRFKTLQWIKNLFDFF